MIVSIGGVAGSVTLFYWRDGYTANVGIGRELSVRFAAAVSLGYDRGVGKDADAGSTNTYTLNAGIKLKQGMFEWQVGGMVGYLKGSDWVTAINATMRIVF